MIGLIIALHLINPSLDKCNSLDSAVRSTDSVKAFDQFVALNCADVMGDREND